VHISCIIVTQLKRLTPFKTIRYNPAITQQLLAAACAVGVSSTFGSPIGGVLFAFEVTCHYYLSTHLYSSFFCAVVGALVFAEILHIDALHTSELALVSDKLRFPPFATGLSFFDYTSQMLFFGFLGGCCGLAGACFVKLVSHAILLRRKYQHRFFGADLKGDLIVTAIVSGFFAFVDFHGPLKMHLRHAINDLFCADVLVSGNSACDLNHSEWGPSLQSNLVLFFFVKMASSAVSVTLPCPGGVITSTFAIGAAFGRLVGEIIRANGFMFGVGQIVPGALAVACATAMTAQVTGTISIAIISFELTRELSYCVPVLVASVSAVAVGNVFGSSFFDEIGKFRKMPKRPVLQNQKSHTLTAEDVMCVDVDLFVERKASSAQISRVVRIAKEQLGGEADLTADEKLLDEKLEQQRRQQKQVWEAASPHLSRSKKLIGNPLQSDDTPRGSSPRSSGAENAIGGTAGEKAPRVSIVISGLAGTNGTKPKRRRQSRRQSWPALFGFGEQEPAKERAERASLNWSLELVPIVDNKENMLIVGCCQVQHLVRVLQLNTRQNSPEIKLPEVEAAVEDFDVESNGVDPFRPMTLSQMTMSSRHWASAQRSSKGGSPTKASPSKSGTTDAHSTAAAAAVAADTVSDTCANDALSPDAVDASRKAPLSKTKSLGKLNGVKGDPNCDYCRVDRMRCPVHGSAGAWNEEDEEDEDAVVLNRQRSTSAPAKRHLSWMENEGTQRKGTDEEKRSIVSVRSRDSRKPVRTMSGRGLEKLIDMGYTLQTGYKADPRDDLELDLGSDDDDDNELDGERTEGSVARVSASAKGVADEMDDAAERSAESKRHSPRTRHDAHGRGSTEMSAEEEEGGEEAAKHDLLQLLSDCDFNHPHVTCTTPLPHVCFLFHAHRCSRIFICDQVGARILGFVLLISHLSFCDSRCMWQGMVVGYIDPSFIDGTAHLPVL
jgi:H+/Cl- antiporter ClcA